MKNQLNLFAILLFSVFLFGSCKEDNPSLSQSGLLKNEFQHQENLSPFGTGATEIGYEFIPTTNGKITALGLKISSAGDYVVRVYDDMKNIVAQKKLEITSSGSLQYAAIDHLIIQKDRKYMILVQTTKGTYAYKRDIGFPFAVGNISITQCAERIDGTLYLGPATTAGNSLAGIPDFVFASN